MKYLLTGLYIAIKSRRPDGTPYYNTMLFITLCIDLYIFDVMLLLERLNIYLVPKEKGLFLGSAIVFSVLIVFTLSKAFPEDDLKRNVIEKNTVKYINAGFFAFFFLSIFLLIYLLRR